MNTKWSLFISFYLNTSISLLGTTKCCQYTFTFYSIFSFSLDQTKQKLITIFFFFLAVLASSFLANEVASAFLWNLFYFPVSHCADVTKLFVLERILSRGFHSFQCIHSCERREKKNGRSIYQFILPNVILYQKRNHF